MSHRCKLLPFLIPLMLPITLHARSILVEGQIVDASTGLPLAAVNLSSATTGAYSDSTGHFSLTLAIGDSLLVSHIGYQQRTLWPQEATTFTIHLYPSILTTSELVVHGGLKTQRLAETASSVTIIDRRTLDAAGNHHLQDLTQTVANLNWAGGTSRPRYFQIRGIGERSHYAGEGPPNFAVGFVIDDVDMSGLGTAGLLFDMDQLEIFKGPQSTSFGPNALAGLISMQSANPQPKASQKVEFALGGDALAQFNGILNQPLTDKLALRIGYHQARANGFRENKFLGTDDTNRRRERFARAKLRYIDDQGLALTLTAFRSDQNNGYDAWSPDNNEDLFTYSDKPGKDHQTTAALSLKSEKTFAKTQLVSITALSDTKLEYSYDSDWGNDDYWRQDPFKVTDWSYDYADRTIRQRNTFTQEFRLVHGETIAGAYYKNLEETDDALGWLFSGNNSTLQSTYRIGNLAFYGQHAHPLSANTRLALNLRIDHNSIDYIGTTDATDRIDFDISQWLTGGKLALIHTISNNRTLYAAAARGYRAGGINQHPRLDAQNRPYDPEYLHNFEIGYHDTKLRSTTSLVLFHALRDNQQVNLSSQQDPGNPNSFFYFIANASKGRTSGIELEKRQMILPGFWLSSSLGLLKTHIDAYTFATASGETNTLGDREAAHAPTHTRRLAADYTSPSGFSVRLETTVMGSFYHSDSHDQKSNSYRLFNGHLGYKRGLLILSLWGRNLLDKRYTVRGFFFGLAPPEYAETLYKSYGDPRQLGLSLSATFQ